MKMVSQRDAKDVLKRIVGRGVEEIVDRDHLVVLLQSGRTLRIKFGIDPTGTNIHLGHAIPIRKLRDFQVLGHTIVLIIGDFTATIGDPSDKLSKRPMLTESDVRKNMEHYEQQLAKIIDIKKTEIRYNSEWLAKLSMRELAGLAESFSIQQMLHRRNFQERQEKNEDISMREILYPLFQGYDSVAVEADIEVGGFDQLFNLLAGRTIQKYYKKPQQDVITTPMLEGTDGRKMSKSWGNVVNITDAPHDMFGKIMSVRDELIEKYFLLCTDLFQEGIEKITQTITLGGARVRDAKLRLAEAIVTLYHSPTEARRARDDFLKTFSQKQTPEDVAVYTAKKGERWDVFLVRARLVASKSEAKRLLQSGAIDCNGTTLLSHGLIEAGGAVRIGKNRFIRVVLE